MRCVVGYDRDFARQFFLRNVRIFLKRPEFGSITEEEIRYLSLRFSEQVSISCGNELATPEYRVDLERFIDPDFVSTNMRRSRFAEWLANHLLFYGGLRAFGLDNLRKRDERPPSSLVIRALYHNAAKANFRGMEETFVLLQLGHNAPEWIRLLAFVPGNDLLEMLALHPSRFAP